MEFTSEQDRAIRTHDQNVILVAGAGSGKTRVLVERFLSLLEANESWPLSALVAVTFTIKAAEEMRDRIRLALENRVNDPDRFHEIDRWAMLLSQVDSARIGTIHSLCTTILRANAANIGIDPDFAVLDEIDSALLLENTIDSVIAQLANENAPELKLFAHYGEMRVRSVLTNSSIYSMPIADQASDWFATWDQRWNENFSASLDRFTSHPLIDKLNQLDKPDSDLLSDVCAHTLAAIDHISRSNELESRFLALSEICSLSLRGGSAKNWGSSEQFDDVKLLLTKVRDYAKMLVASVGERPGQADQSAAEWLPLWFSLVDKVRHAFADAKRLLPALDFDDLEVLTCDLLKSYPEVRSRYQSAEFRHLLVDEFQDTNARQWEIVQALAVLDQPGTLFVVGDQKQSIYAFRGADVSVFGDVRAQIVGMGGHEIQMARSFRTHIPLVNAFNSIFERLLVRDETSPTAAYQVVMDEPMTAERDLQPYDEPIISLILIDKAERSPAETSSDETEKLSAEARRQWEAQEIADHIQRMVQSGVHIHEQVNGSDSTRAVRYGDFAILFQALSQVSIYESALAAAAIPYVTVAGRGYYNRQEVWDLLNLLRCVHNQSDDLSLAAALRSPLFALSDNALFALRIQPDDALQDEHARPIRLWDALSAPGPYFPDEELEHLQFAVQVLHALRGIAGRVTIYELLLEALSLTGYLATLSGLPHGARMRGNVEKLLAKAQERGNVTLAAFIAYLGDMSDREVREGEAASAADDAVQLMTVHKSKGLEFPVVIIADASWTNNAGQNDLLLFDQHEGWVCQVINPDTMQLEKPFMHRMLSQYARERDDAERRRLLYVAATRTRDFLIVSGQAENKDGVWKSKGWLDQILHAFDLDDYEITAVDSLLSYEWGQLHLHAPEQRPQSKPEHTTEQSAYDWSPDWSVEPVMPPLMQNVTANSIQNAQHLAASHMMKIGEIQNTIEPAERRKLIAQFHNDTSLNITDTFEQTLSGLRNSSGRIVGEIVHEALRFGQLPSMVEQSQLITILQNYGWRKQLTDPELCESAANHAYHLLQQFEASPAYAWMTNAEELYSELPFVIEIEGIFIHGIIDALLRDSEDQWRLIDFKTGFAPANIGALAKHARSFHLQVAIYARAVEMQLNGVTPQVYIHFIQQPQNPIRIPESEWRSALKQNLHQQISEIFEDHDRD